MKLHDFDLWNTRTEWSRSLGATSGTELRRRVEWVSRNSPVEKKPWLKGSAEHRKQQHPTKLVHEKACLRSQVKMLYIVFMGSNEALSKDRLKVLLGVTDDTSINEAFIPPMVYGNEAESWATKQARNWHVDRQTPPTSLGLERLGRFFVGSGFLKWFHWPYLVSTGYTQFRALARREPDHMLACLGVNLFWLRKNKMPI